MEQNVGSTDRIVRAIVGILIGAIGIAGLGEVVAVGTEVSILLTVIGVVLLGTAALRLCVLYKILNVRTSS